MASSVVLQVRDLQNDLLVAALVDANMGRGRRLKFGANSSYEKGQHEGEVRLSCKDKELIP